MNSVSTTAIDKQSRTVLATNSGPLSLRRYLGRPRIANFPPLTRIQIRLSLGSPQCSSMELETLQQPLLSLAKNVGAPSQR